MTPVEIGFMSIGAIIFLIYIGVYIPIALGIVSFVAIWFMRGNIDLSFALTKIAIGDSAMAHPTARAVPSVIQPVGLLEQWSRNKELLN